MRGATVERHDAVPDFRAVLQTRAEEVVQAGAVGVGLHRSLDGKRQFKSCAALAGSYARLAACAHGVHKRLKLKTQRLARRYLRL